MKNVLDEVRVVGVYTTEVARSLWPRTGFSLALESLRGALDDAGMTIDEIDGIYSSVSDWPPGNPTSVGAFWPSQLNRPVSVSNSSIGITAILEAAGAIATGVVSTAAVVVGQCRQVDPATTAVWTRPSNEFTEWTGSFTAVQYSLVAQRYIYQYGEDALEAMAEASATIRNYGSINPDAIYFGRGPFSQSDVLSSRMIASPLTLLMCSTVTDGGHALVLTRRDRAADSRKLAIRIITGGIQIPYPAYYEAPEINAGEDEGEFVQARMKSVGLSHNDIDLIELYDHFAIGVLMEFEMFGFCARGEAAAFVRSGVMRLDGQFPTCTDGGNLSFSHNGRPALYKVIEAVRQLRGEVKDSCAGGHTHQVGSCRAVSDAELAFVTNPGPPTGGGSFLVLAKGG